MKNSKKWIKGLAHSHWIFLLLCVIGSSAWSQVQQGSLLWKVTGPSIKTTYLLGTIHLTCDATLKKKTQKALANSDQLVLEMDFDDPSLAMGMMQAMNMQGGKTLKLLMNAADYILVQQFIEQELGISLNMLPSIKPIFLQTMLFPKMLDCPTQSIETMLSQQVKKEGKTLIGLETLEEQMAALEAISYEEQATQLVDLVKNKMVNEKKEIQQMMDLYRAENLDGLYQLIQEGAAFKSAEFDQKLLIDRNNRWMQKFKSMLAEKSLFIGVGAAHLAGPNGLIALFRKSGFTVEPVY
ncbi:MAG: TraB/GumN family protein [Flavobacterium sp. BFFFF2]|nr:MAG: TraB/GumN family protein [Flavobacterium sp. BFFFF2]